MLTSEEGRSLGVERRNFGGCDAPRWERDLLDSRVTRSGRGGYLSAGVRTPVCAEVMTVTEASDSYDAEESNVRKTDVVGSERLWRKQVGLVEGLWSRVDQTEEKRGETNKTFRPSRRLT